ncbi:MAG: hypothetical protein Q8P02_04500, partial [Candidatus Micrarchaeota archaeon]|nr:hypothetical protein [Candidatus Micrarchaeota archaeon]
MRKIYCVFTRDFDQCIEETIRDLLLTDCAALWGQSISDQIIRFTGRTFEWYRYEDDMQALREWFVAKPLHDPIYSQAEQDRFIQTVVRLRTFLSK